MDRYIWFINGLPEYKAKPILIKRRLDLSIIKYTKPCGDWFIVDAREKVQHGGKRSTFALRVHEIGYLLRETQIKIAKAPIWIYF
ncbi:MULTISPECIES: hypothetical protein [Legionella]|nr:MULTISPECIES: hypothetical protein [Legionella]